MPAGSLKGIWNTKLAHSTCNIVRLMRDCVPAEALPRSLKALAVAKHKWDKILKGD